VLPCGARWAGAQVIAAARITLQQGARIVHETSAKGD
jgi:hypothetical protein